MKLDQYLKKLDGEGKICLEGKYWDEAFTIVTGSKKRDNSVLSNPLILSGWHYSDDQEKSNRFREHLTYAYEYGTWTQLLKFIDNLSDEAWYKQTNMNGF